MKIFFNQPAFDGQLLRVISHTFLGAADIGECLSTAAHVTEGNFDSWRDEWIKTADRLFSIAEESEQRQQYVSAAESYLRASNYYRVSLFFHYDSPLAKEILYAFDRHTLSFEKAMTYTSPLYRRVKIPFEDTTLPGYFYKCQESEDPRPVFIVNGGYDSTHQEAYFSFVPLALKRGYHVLAFDGPGQGTMLFKQDVHMRHDWETVLTPVVDYLEELPEVDERQIVLYGPSWGGMLAPRAAAFEKRIAGLIVNPGQWDVLLNIKLAVDGEDQEAESDPMNTDDFLQGALQDKYFARKLYSKMFIHGLETPSELIKEWEQFHLMDIAEKIECPTLVCDSENEPLSTGQAQLLYDALQCPKKYHLFTSTLGAGEHCCAGAVGYLSQVLFDWTEETLHANFSAKAIT